MTIEEISELCESDWVIAKGDTDIVVLLPSLYYYVNRIEEFMGRAKFSNTPRHIVYKFPPYFDTSKIEAEIRRIKNQYKVVKTL